MITLYRAVCKEEVDKTLHFQSLQYSKNKEKCFSPDITWIRTRVQDGKFNNSVFEKKSTRIYLNMS